LIIAMLLGLDSLCAHDLSPRLPARLAIYYGYPSQVNGARGDVEKAASVFSAYDVVVLGDGVEFADLQPGRRPEGVGAQEHNHAAQIIRILKDRHPATRVFGYVCLGDSQALSNRELKQRILLWSQMKVAGIFLDEAGYDWKIVTRLRQNTAVGYIHQLGLSAFLNAYRPEDLFSLENISEKNPGRISSRLGARDLFLLESFQIKSGSYEFASEWQQRLLPALAYRQKYGSHIFATTTAPGTAPFSLKQFDYAWWSAWLYDLDGFGWGEPNFAASSAALPDHRCTLNRAVLEGLRGAGQVASDGVRFRRAGRGLVAVVDTRDHSVRFASPSQGVESMAAASRLAPRPPAPLPACETSNE
jgi:hypothetical protein